MDYSEKLRNCFDEMVVYKDLKKTNFFTALSLPAFMRDWLLKKFEDDDDLMERWGLVDSEFFYVVKSRFEKICTEAGYNSKSLLSWMKQTGKIEVSKGYTKTKRINGEAVSCVWIIKDPNGQMQLEDVADSEQCPF